MKNIFYIFLFLALNCFAQEMSTTTGIIKFEASVPLFEAVESTTKTGNCILNLKNGELKIFVVIKDFQFKMGLMEQHFNDYYLESHRYPKAIFKGKIIDFNRNMIGNIPKGFKVKGRLEIHGKRRDIETVAFLRKIDKKLEIISNFNIKTTDYNISIPTMLQAKIAETVTIHTNFIVE